MTNDSHFSEYQNQKEFENRFNASRLINSNNFGVHSYLEQTHTNRVSRIQPISSSDKQINQNEQHVEDEIK
jgi:hypothetical protein